MENFTPPQQQNQFNLEGRRQIRQQAREKLAEQALNICFDGNSILIDDSATRALFLDGVNASIDKKAISTKALEILREKIQDLRREKIAMSQAEIDSQLAKLARDKLKILKIQAPTATNIQETILKNEENGDRQEEYPTYKINLVESQLSYTINKIVNAFFSIYLDQNKGRHGYVIYHFNIEMEELENGLFGVLRKICKDTSSDFDLKQLIRNNDSESLVDFLKDEMKVNFLEMIKDLKICENYFNDPANVTNISLEHVPNPRKNQVETASNSLELSNQELYCLVRGGEKRKINGGVGSVNHKKDYVVFRLKHSSFHVPDPSNIHTFTDSIYYYTFVTYKADGIGNVEDRIFKILKKLMTVKIEIKE